MRARNDNHTGCIDDSVAKVMARERGSELLAVSGMSVHQNSVAPWMPCRQYVAMETTPFADKPTLYGELVTLRPIRADDADAIDAIIRDDEVARLTGSVRSSAEKPAGTPLEKLRDIYGAWAVADDRLVLAVIDNTTDELVGEVVLNDWDEDNESCGFRTLIGAAGSAQRRPDSSSSTA